MFCCTLLYVYSIFANILVGKREQVALLSLSSLCLLMVVWLFLAVPWVCLRFVIVVFPDHTHLLLLYKQVVGIPMGTNCAPLVADLFLFCYERDFMIALSFSVMISKLILLILLLPRSCPGVGLRGTGGVKNFSVGICDGAPSTARSSIDFVCIHLSHTWILF